MPRPPLPEGAARTELVAAKVRPAAKEEFTRTWQDDPRFHTEADAVRHALNLYVTERKKQK